MVQRIGNCRRIFEKESLKRNFYLTLTILEKTKMNKIVLISILLILFISCKKEETPETEIPEWFLPQIEELENSNQCFGCTITRLSYNNSTYYDLYCSYWSTLYRHLYDSEGNHIEWDNIEDYNHFMANKMDEKVIWKCGDKIN